MIACVASSELRVSRGTANSVILPLVLILRMNPRLIAPNPATPGP